MHDDAKAETFSTTIISIIGLAMLLVPLWLLDKVQGDDNRLEIITAFIALFFFLLKVVIEVKVFKALGACAAYSAVLMVFLQINSSSESAAAKTGT